MFPLVSGYPCPQCDARDGHGIQEIKALKFALFVVVLKGHYSPRDDLSLSVNPVGEGPVFGEHQEDKGWITDKAHAHLNNATGFTANRERNGATHKYKDRILVEAHELQCLGGEAVHDTPLEESDGKVEVAEVLDGSM